LQQSAPNTEITTKRRSSRINKQKVEEMLSVFTSINIPVDDINSNGTIIGTGGFGTVFKAVRFSTSEVVAVKELRKDRLFTPSSRASLYSEITTIASLKHPYILQLVGAHISTPYRIITRYCNGKSLYFRLHKTHPHLTIQQLNRIGYQVAVGMAYLHSMGIVHPDLKTLNILLDEENDSCVADFGLSQMMKENQEIVGGVGTPQYNAPEILLRTPYGRKVDTYSYGVILWEIATGKIPYIDMTHQAIYEHVINRGRRLPIPNEHPDGLKKLISRCWSHNPNDRPEFDEIIKMWTSGTVYFQSPATPFLPKKQKTMPPIDFNYVSKNNFCHSQSTFQLKTPTLFCCFLSYILKENEFVSFFDLSGLNLFIKAIKSKQLHQITAAVRLGLRIPDSLLNKTMLLLDDIFEFLDKNPSSGNGYIFRFLNRFNLEKFSAPLINALYESADQIVNQETFDAVSNLLSKCDSKLKKGNFSKFSLIMRNKFHIPIPFCQLLIDKCHDNYSDLIIDILYGCLTSYLVEPFNSFLAKTVSSKPEILTAICSYPSVFTLIQSVLESPNAPAALYLLFLIASSQETALTLVGNPILDKLMQLQVYRTHVLAILEHLVSYESFCSKSLNLSQIVAFVDIHFKQHIEIPNAMRFLAIISSHQTGAHVLDENRIPDMLVQLFFEPTDFDSLVFLPIFRNFATFNIKIPLIDLIISCLFQDVILFKNKSDVLETLIQISQTHSIDINASDIEKVVLQPIDTENPRQNFLILKLLSVVCAFDLRRLQSRLLFFVLSILNSPQLHYPEIISEAGKLITSLPNCPEITEAINECEVQRFFQEYFTTFTENDSNKLLIEEILQPLFNGRLSRLSE
jgi:serine/threonine protein kinase